MGETTTPPEATPNDPDTGLPAEDEETKEGDGDNGSDEEDE